jgi:2-(1,2-epoxy-1,2-dihydrophenyl)acetyl-CoA isomerase
MTAALVTYSVADHVATVTLDRPQKLNAFADDMRDQLLAAIDRVAADPSAGVLVITGAGRAFCAGGDVGYMATLKQRDASFDDLRPLLDIGGAIVSRLDAMPIPTIAAVNGVAAGAGLNLALACDLRIASDEATFSESFVKIGLCPDWGGTFALTPLVGLAKALELCWTGDAINAPEALRIGLVNRVVPLVKFGSEVAAFASRLAALPQTSLRWTKRILRASTERTLAQCLDAEAEAQEACWASADVAEGLKAFVEKRDPRFTGDAIEGAAPLVGAARHFE